MRDTALYIRVSHEEQKLNGDSLRAQKDELIAYCNQHKIKNYRIYEDAGVSATNFKKRKALQQLLIDIENNEIECVLFVRLDRWFRNHYYHTIQSTLDSHNVYWKAVLQNLETQTASGRLMVNVLLSVAQNEVEQTSERIKMTFKNKLLNKEVISGQCPYGYKIENKHYVINEEEALIVRETFELFVQFQSLVKVKNQLLEKYKYNITHSNIRNRLRNKLYIGIYEKNGYHIDEFCDPIVDKELFYTVQDILKSRSKIKTSKNCYHYLFTGLIKCNCCGHSMIGKQTVMGNSVFYHYRCSFRQNNKHICNNKNMIQEKVFEELVLQELNTYIENTEVNIQSKTKTEKINYQKQLKSVKEKIKKISHLYMNDLVDLEYYKNTFQELKKQENELLLIIDKKPKIDTMADEIKKAIDIYAMMDNQQKKVFWVFLIDKIEILEIYSIKKDNNKQINTAKIKVFFK